MSPEDEDGDDDGVEELDFGRLSFAAGDDEDEQPDPGGDNEPDPGPSKVSEPRLSKGLPSESSAKPSRGRQAIIEEIAEEVETARVARLRAVQERQSIIQAASPRKRRFPSSWALWERPAVRRGEWT